MINKFKTFIKVNEDIRFSKFKVGDKVRCVYNKCESYNKIGTIIDVDDLVKKVLFDDGEQKMFSYDSSLELMEDIGDYEVWEDETNEEYNYEKNEFEIGDVVKCISHGDFKEHNYHEIGETDVVTKISYNGCLGFEKSKYLNSEKRYKLVDDKFGNYEVWEDETNEEYNYEKDEFEVGERVFVKGYHSGKYINNEIATILDIFNNMFLLEFDKPVSEVIKWYKGHNGSVGWSEKRGKSGHCLYVINHHKLELIKDELKGDYEVWEDETNEEYNKIYETYTIGDIVNINYWVTNEPTAAKITDIKTVNGKKMYTISFDLRAHQDMFNSTTIDGRFFNAPNMTVTEKDIINPVFKINTPAGPGWITNDPNLQIAQVSNDMYM